MILAGIYEKSTALESIREYARKQGNGDEQLAVIVFRGKIRGIQDGFMIILDKGTFFPI